MVLNNLSIIVAVAKNGAIGRKNQLLWHIPEDLKYFKELTMGHHIVMGENTWFSLPVKPLPGRTSVVLSYDLPDSNHYRVFRNIPDTLDYIAKQDDSCFIIGGASVYKQFIAYAQKLYITWIDENCTDADAFFPVEQLELFNVISEKPFHSEKANLNLTYTVYERK
jgi:dihydrofolate reductase